MIGMINQILSTKEQDERDQQAFQKLYSLANNQRTLEILTVLL